MSSFIQLQQISFGFPEHNSELFSDLSCSFNSGWTSICGANGSGKTTLLRLMQNELEPTSGSISKKGSLAFIPQNTECEPEGLQAFRFEYSRFALKIREILSINDEWFERWQTLSIGERKRLQIAVALTQQADILLVDEPTNHVDVSARKAILDALLEFNGVGILISHDRLLLNQLCQRTIFLNSSHLEVFSAPYDRARDELDSLHKFMNNQKDKLKKTESRLKQAAQSQREKIERGRRKLSKHGVANKDHDTKEKINRAKLFGADLADSRKRQILLDRSRKASENLAQIKTTKTYDLGVFFQSTIQVKPIQIAAKIITRSYLTIECPEIILHPGDKLVITGANGAGKTTLLTHLIPEIKQSLAYAPQESDQAEGFKLIDKINKMQGDKKGLIFTLVSCFGSNPKRLASGSPPSPGVWQKLMIAQAIVHKVPVLVLDEPTNHMDLQALEILEEALIRFQGIIICISHDHQFISRVCNMKLNLTKNNQHAIADFE